MVKARRPTAPILDGHPLPTPIFFITNSPRVKLSSYGVCALFWILSVEAWGPHSVSPNSNTDLYEHFCRPELYLTFHLCSLCL